MVYTNAPAMVSALVSTRVAVIVPVAPGVHEHLAREAVASAVAAGADHVIAVGDACSPRVTSYPNVSVHRLPDGKRGRSAARNHGLAIAHQLAASWSFFLDSDDRMFDHAVHDWRCLRVLHPEASLFYADFPLIVDGQDAGFHYSPPFDRALFEDPERVLSLNLSSPVFCKTARALAIGGFNEALNLREDSDWWLRYATNPRVEVIKHSRPFVAVRAESSAVPDEHDDLGAQMLRDLRSGAYEPWQTV
jgi:hypothetical protein